MAYVGAQTVCGWCGELSTVAADGRCETCGGHHRLLEPFAVDCGWCHVANRRDLRAECIQCGGHLPALPGNHPGAVPPSTPRWLPKAYTKRIMLWKNPLVILGLVFVIPFGWTVILPLIGLPMLLVGLRNGRRQLATLRAGTPTRGRISDVRVDESQHINNQHPWLIRYAYDTPSGTHEGSTHAWDPFSAQRKVGDVLWVVHQPGPPALSEIWPPIH